ncbi:helix-turn-helix domain-containing protein [Flaviaesturariibacter terrae]
MTIHDYNTLAGQPTLHPLVSVLDFSKTGVRRQFIDAGNVAFDFYAVFLKDEKHCDIRYGRNYYDFQSGTLVFMAPGQVFSIERRTPDYVPAGYALLFHPDLIRGTALGQHMKDYGFFSYEAHEALHLSEAERGVVVDCFHRIALEMQQGVDKHTKTMIASNIELFLNYCLRFYDRQFLTREQGVGGIGGKFAALLDDYFNSGKAQALGVPTVSYFAAQLHFSANYFGDLVRKETGRSALEQIHTRLVEAAKSKIFDGSKSLSEVAYELGFKYPQHFTRFFKQQEGRTPNEYRSALN